MVWRHTAKWNCHPQLFLRKFFAFVFDRAELANDYLCSFLLHPNVLLVSTICNEMSPNETAAMEVSSKQAGPFFETSFGDKSRERLCSLAFSLKARFSWGRYSLGRSELQEIAESNGLLKSFSSCILKEMCCFVPKAEADQAMFLRCSLPWSVLVQLEGKHKAMRSLLAVGRCHFIDEK